MPKFTIRFDGVAIAYPGKSATNADVWKIIFPFRTRTGAATTCHKVKIRDSKYGESEMAFPKTKISVEAPSTLPNKIEKGAGYNTFINLYTYHPQAQLWADWNDRGVVMEIPRGRLSAVWGKKRYEFFANGTTALSGYMGVSGEIDFVADRMVIRAVSATYPNQNVTRTYYDDITVMMDNDCDGRAENMVDGDFKFVYSILNVPTANECVLKFHIDEPAVVTEQTGFQEVHSLEGPAEDGKKDPGGEPKEVLPCHLVIYDPPTFP